MAPASVDSDVDSNGDLPRPQIIEGIFPHPKGITGRMVTVDTSLSSQEQQSQLERAPAAAEETEEKEPENVPPKRKKKKSKKKKKPTGFEENYADAPMTPAERSEELNDLYHPRIEQCIQRYRARRRFDSERKDIFDKYLSLGGINTGPKMFSGGIDPKSVAEKDADEIATMAATDAVPSYNVGGGKSDADWIIDFEGVAKCFFSSRVPACFDLAIPGKIQQCTDVVRNFLNYVLHHDVCPEYNDQVYAARAVCDQARDELTRVSRLSRAFPGDFNVACSTLYGGWYQGLYVGDKSWAQGYESALGMSDAQANETVMVALAAHGTTAQVEQAVRGPRVVRSEEAGFEVKEVVACSDELKHWYATEVKKSIKPLGKLKVTRWINPDGAYEDMAVNATEVQTESLSEGDTFEIWLEDDLLQHCFPGMKVEATLRALDCGITHIDMAQAVLCSFFVTLDDEGMIGWKQPGPRDQEEPVEEIKTGLEDERIRSHFEEG